tara:strand:+ start:367 stop:567 length:201 start_codon:yes stop_codon:yes gene_type:complete
MKIEQQQKTKIETIVNSIEKKLEQIKQQDYVYYDGRNWMSFSEIDFPSLKAMINNLKKASRGGKHE